MCTEGKKKKKIEGEIESTMEEKKGRRRKGEKRWNWKKKVLKERKMRKNVNEKGTW